jgi:hypothetical protein
MNKNDIVYTPREFSKKIINHFKPSGLCLDPCKGDGAFFDYLPKPKDWCEIRENRNFYDYNKKVDWIISNPPFSEYDNFLKKSFEVADNVCFIIPLYKVYKSLKQQKLVNSYGGLKEVLIIGSGSKLNFNFGFLCGVVYYKKDYKGLIKESWLI